MVRVILAAVAAILITAGIAACGSGKSTSSTSSSGAGKRVSATAYITTVCTAEAPYQKASSTNPLSGTGLTARVAKQKLITYIDTVGSDVSALVTKLQGAGYPDVTGGKTDAAAVLKTYSDLNSALGRAKTLAAKLPTNSLTAFEAGTKTIGTTISSAVSADSSGLEKLSSPALTKAADKVKACQSVSGSSS